MDLQDSFIHFQGNEILSGEQQCHGVCFPYFPHADALDEMETILVPNVDDPTFFDESVNLWKESQWYNSLWGVPHICEWNKCIDQMWQPTFHKCMDPYLSILKQHAEGPLIERIVELEVDLEEITIGTAHGSPTPDFIRDAILAEETKPAVAGLSKK